MLRHCTMAELLEVRDGQGTAAARNHIEECAACRAELERVHQRVAALKALPSLRPPRDRWPVVRETLVGGRRRRWNRGVAVSGLAAAAVVALAVGIRGITSVPQEEPVVVEGPAVVAYPVALESLVGESRRLEEVLWAVGRRGRVVDGLTATAIADLEDRISLIDAGIQQAGMIRASPREMTSLWQQRVVLMNTLVNVHVRQVGYEGY